MTIQNTLPENYTVAQVGKHWYPLQVERYYSIHSPEGQMMFFTCDASKGAIHFPTRKEAVKHSFCASNAETYWQERRWEQIAVKSDVYPERCSHYQDIIEVTTGYSPLVHTLSFGVSVFIPGFKCGCGQYHLPIEVTDATYVEDALEEAANMAYQASRACDCSTLPALIAG